MTKEQLRLRHIHLHQSFDELLACFLAQDPHRRGPSSILVSELMDWSFHQTRNPKCAGHPAVRPAATPAGPQKLKPDP